MHPSSTVEGFLTCEMKKMVDSFKQQPEACVHKIKNHRAGGD